MKTRKHLPIFAAIPLLLFGAWASADPITHEDAEPLHIVGLDDTGFSGAMTGMSMHTIDLNSYAEGTVSLGPGQKAEFSDQNGDAPNRETAAANSWWHGSNYYFLGTHTNSIVVDFLNMNVVGFSFSINANGANYKAWVGATAVTSDGGPFRSIGQTDWFGDLDRNPARQVGVYLNGTSQSCASISQVVVDPDSTWGIGDLTYYTNPDCATVPEPGTLALLGMGLFGFGVMRRRRMAAQHA